MYSKSVCSLQNHPKGLMAAIKANALVQELHKAASAIRNAKALVVTAGAGLGVDSGLPDFRGREGFWREYPPLKKLGFNLTEMNNPRWFENDPNRAWGFFGHCYNMYKTASPHEGFKIMKEWADKMEFGYFVYTSNVDGHFQKAGFSEDKIVEAHGSIYFMQCVNPQSSPLIWPVPEDTHFNIDEETLRLQDPCPRGPPGSETSLARPNVLMFGDWNFISRRTDAQEKKFLEFKKHLLRNDASFVVLEIGAGLAVPTVRMTGEGMLRSKGTLIRINAFEPQAPKGSVSLPLTGLEALQKIQQYLHSDTPVK